MISQLQINNSTIMRKFSSYGPVDTDLHFYAPRTELVEDTYQQLRGADPGKGGHYITVWAPRQTGKTWLLQQVVQRLTAADEFAVAILTMQSAKTVKTVAGILELLVTDLRNWFSRPDLPMITEWQQLRAFFTTTYFDKPVILILDEFDALEPDFINAFANEFRSIHTQRQNERNNPNQEVTLLLHGLALIGVRSVLGIENVTGSPFNVQRSIHVPNLTQAEVAAMFRWYEAESGQLVEQAVVDRLFYETRGQPGLVGWFGELLTETYNRHDGAITAHDWEIAFFAGLNLLPNNNILNIISKAKEEPYRETVLKLFNTDQKIAFRYDNRHLNYLYLNGVIEPQPEAEMMYSTRFASPFVQKRLFHYFADQLTPTVARLYDPLADLSDTITETHLSLPHLLQRYAAYLHQHRDRLLKHAPRRESDNRVFEAVFHFNLYTYLLHFLADFDGRVTPEFPTGNGKIDLLITYANRLYGLEVKSFTNRKRYHDALGQAARYAQQLQQPEIWLAFFIDTIDDANRQQLEAPYQDSQTGVRVQPIFVVIGG